MWEVIRDAERAVQRANGRRPVLEWCEVRTEAGVAEESASATGLSGHRRSLVRLQAGVVFGVFVCCWLYLRYVSGNSVFAFAVAGISSVSMWFIRCEQCHSSLYYRAGGRRFPSYGLTFLIHRRCPHCGLERL